MSQLELFNSIKEKINRDHHIYITLFRFIPAKRNTFYNTVSLSLLVQNLAHLENQCNIVDINANISPSMLSVQSGEQINFNATVTNENYNYNPNLRISNSININNGDTRNDIQMSMAIAQMLYMYSHFRDPSKYLNDVVELGKSLVTMIREAMVSDEVYIMESIS